MSVIYVARSSKLSKWASDVGLSKNIFKVGCTDEPVKPLVEAGWAGEGDWTLIKTQEAEGLSEEDVIARLSGKERAIEPNLYPKLKGATGIFKVSPTNVENHIIVARALAGGEELRDLKLKPADFAAYLIHNALR